jgi:hypothetical protein
MSLTLHLEQCFYCCSAFQVTVGSLTMRTTHTQMTNWFFWRHDESNRMSECHLMIVLPFPRWSNMVLAYCLWCQKPSQSNAHVNNPRSLLNNYKFIFSASNITCFSHIFSSGWKQWLLCELLSPRFLCRPTAFFRLAISRKKGVGRQRNLGLVAGMTNQHLELPWFPADPRVNHKSSHCFHPLEKIWEKHVILLAEKMNL